MSLRQQPGVPTSFPKGYAQRTSIQPQNADDEQAYCENDDVEDYDDASPSHLPRSAIRWQGLTTQHHQRVVTTQQGPHQIVRYRYQQVPPRQSRTQDAVPPVRSPQKPPAQHPLRHRVHWSVYVGLIMLLMLAGWTGLSLGLSWWHGYQDDLRYGYPRTYQTDMAVGHGKGASHFLALNMHGHLEVIECPEGDCARATIYVGPVLFGPAKDLMPVTLTFRDLTGSGRLDMLLVYGDQTAAFLNTGTSFRPATVQDHITL